MVQLNDIKVAQDRIKDVVRMTPLDLSQTLSDRFGRNIYLKLENLQKTGSFKIRGAYNKLKLLTDAGKVKGVVAASAGNHAQGVAYAAKLLGLPAIIVMPEGAPISKVTATRDYGAEVVFYGDTTDDCFTKVAEIQQEYNYELIHPFDDPAIIAGQGTLGLELLKQLDEIDCAVVPIGGGGLISGVALALKEVKPSIKIIGVEAAGAASMLNSVTLDQIDCLKTAQTIADGIAIKQPGKLGFSLVKKYVDDLITVTDEEISSAILFLLERNKLVLEGAGAAPLGALLHGHLKLPSGPSGNTALILSGGNIDINHVSRIIERGLVKANRQMRLRIIASDRPGSLHELTKIIAQYRGNIIAIEHNRVALDVLINSAEVIMSLETRDLAHANQIINALNNGGYETRLYP